MKINDISQTRKKKRQVDEVSLAGAKKAANNIGNKVSSAYNTAKTGVQNAYNDIGDDSMTGGRNRAEKAGGWGGAGAGAGTGAALGSVFGPLGTAVGAGIGAIGGSKLGSEVAGSGGNWLAKQGLFGTKAGARARAKEYQTQANRTLATKFITQLENDFENALLGGVIRESTGESQYQLTTIKHDIFDDFSSLDTLVESVILNEAATAGQWLTNYVNKATKNRYIKDAGAQNDIKNIADQFQAAYSASPGQFPAKLGPNIYGLVMSLMKHDETDNERNGATANEITKWRAELEKHPKGSTEYNKILGIIERLSGSMNNGSAGNAAYDTDTSADTSTQQDQGSSAPTAQQTLKDLAFQMRKYVNSQNAIDGQANDSKEALNIITQLFKYLGKLDNGLALQQRVYKAMDRMMRDAKRAQTDSVAPEEDDNPNIIRSNNESKKFSKNMV